MRGDPLPVEDDADWLVNFYDSFSGFAKVGSLLYVVCVRVRLLTGGTLQACCQQAQQAGAVCDFA